MMALKHTEKVEEHLQKDQHLQGHQVFQTVQGFPEKVKNLIVLNKNKRSKQQGEQIFNFVEYLMIPWAQSGYVVGRIL